MEVENAQKLNLKFVLLIFLLLSIPFSFGLVISLFSSDQYIRATFNQTFPKTQQIPDFLWGVTNGLMPLGGLIGTLAATYVSAALGRKKCTIIFTLLAFIGDACFFVSYFSKIFVLLVFSRFFHGIGVGGGMNAGLCYYFELLCPKYKRVGGSMVQIFINVGIVVSSIMSLKEISSSLWFIVGLPLLVFHSITIITVVVLPESPFWLYETTKDFESAKNIFIKIRGEHYEGVDKEIDTMKNDIDERNKIAKITLVQFIADSSLRPTTFFMVFLSTAQQVSGINVVIFFVAEFLKPINFQRIDIGSLIMFVVCLLGSIIFTFTMPNANSKLLLVIGFGGMSASFYFGYLFWCIKLNAIWVIICLALFLFTFQAGPGPKPWVIAMETYSVGNQGPAQTVLTTFNWGFNTLITFCYPFINGPVGFHSVLMFALINTVFCIVVLFFMVNSTGKTSEQVILEYQKKFPCLLSIKAKSFDPQMEPLDSETEVT